MELKMPGIMAHGDFQPNLALIQKHRGQQSGKARMPRFLAEIRMNHFVDHVCRGDKREAMPAGPNGLYIWFPKRMKQMARTTGN